MKVRFRVKHIRTRVTLWYVSALGVTLLLYSIGISALLLWQLQRQLGVHAIEDIETVEGLLFFSADGKVHLREDYHNHPESRLVQERFLEVWSASGEVLYRNDKLGTMSLGRPPIPGEGRGGYSERFARLEDGTPIRLVSRRHVLDGHPLLIRLAYSEGSIWQRFGELLIAMLIGLPVALVLAGLAGYLLASRALAPISEMAQRAEQINLERLNARLPVENDDELGHLAIVFNAMLARLEQSFEQLRRFTSDASHELRTPLAAMRSVGEVGLQKAGSREDYRDIIGSMLEEANRLTHLVESLLTLSRADAGQIQLQASVIPVMALMRDSAALLEVLMDEKKQHLILEGDEDARIAGDPLLLRQAFLNVLHNAIKYSPPGGTISVSVGVDKQGSVIASVRDSGPGISPEHREKVFDRFYRIDQARARDSGGAGLGLAIVKWVVQAHAGTIRLDSPADGGSIFCIKLPLAQKGNVVASRSVA
jgi:heavy metal sensor kinase